MGIFKEIINWLAESGKKDAIYYTHKQLKEGYRGLPVRFDGTDPNMEYYEKHGELPGQTCLREFEEKHGLR